MTQDAVNGGSSTDYVVLCHLHSHLLAPAVLAFHWEVTLFPNSVTKKESESETNQVNKNKRERSSLEHREGSTWGHGFYFSLHKGPKHVKKKKELVCAPVYWTVCIKSKERQWQRGYWMNSVSACGISSLSVQTAACGLSTELYSAAFCLDLPSHCPATFCLPLFRQHVLVFTRCPNEDMDPYLTGSFRSHERKYMEYINIYMFFSAESLSERFSGPRVSPDEAVYWRRVVQCVLAQTGLRLAVCVLSK